MVIAGELGFAAEVVRAHASGPVSFDGLELLRSRLCPEASWQASVRGFISAWPAPALYVIAAPGLKADEQRSLDQLGFGFTEPPTPQLRVQQIAFNELGRAAGLYIPRNMRVPKDSVIRGAFEMRTPIAATGEDLAWWGTSDGKHLEPFPVQVEARPYLEGVHAIIVPS